MKIKALIATTTVALTMATGGVANAASRDYISIVGSSTVFPFATVVAERFGRTSSFSVPKIESTGSGGGLKLFCAGIGENTPDITNASRKIKASEVELCAKNGVNDIVEIKIGFDGIVLANSKKAQQFELSLQDVYKGVAKMVPDANGNLVEDGAYIEAGENDNLIVQKLASNPNALGVFGYSFLEENADKVQASIVNGVEPTFDAIGSGEYPVSRSLYFYVKEAHKDTIPGLKEYVAAFTSEQAIGDEGYLADRGLIPLSARDWKLVRAAGTELTPNL
ncbi:substrate-binding domain-containing protein [Vibrio fortis]